MEAVPAQNANGKSPPGDWKRALENDDLTQAIALLEIDRVERPKDFDILRSLGALYARQGKMALAVDTLEKASHAAPSDTHGDIWTELCRNLGFAYCHTKQYDRAFKFLQPLFREHKNQASFLERYLAALNMVAEDEEFLEAIACLLEIYHSRSVPSAGVEAEKHRQVLARTVFNRSMIRLRLGDWLRGWSDYQSRRLAFALNTFRISKNIPEWDGLAPIEDKSLLVIPEQGIGDNAMMMRYAHLLKEAGARLFIFSQPYMVRFYQKSGVFERVLQAGEQIKTPDYQVNMLSLPWLFKTEISSIPSFPPFIAERGFLESPPKKIKCGLVWCGNPKYPNDGHRSVPLDDLLAVLKEHSSDIAFHTLQPDLKEDLRQTPIIHTGAHISDIYDVCRAIADMDFVISVDTAVAHLSGIMGKPVFILLPLSCDWRWLKNRNDSPWYPSARLFRQPCFLDWHTPLEALAEHIEHFKNELTN